MNRGRFINLLMALVVLWLLYQGASWLKLQRDHQRSREIYRELQVEASLQPGAERSILPLQGEVGDLVAWMASDSRRIDHPLVRGSDNETYLHRGANGEQNSLGAIFVDYRNGSLLDPAVFIYGHMMKDDAMFGPLKDFKEPEQAENFTFWTEEQSFHATTKMVSIIPGETTVDPRDYGSLEKKQELYQFLRDHALYELGEAPGPEEPWIILITCTYEWENARLAVLTVREEPEGP
ncbi:MAG: class B sortase [Tissierellia bacterium]|nr:class B sortase [Tissierellia bacterium]